MSSVKPVVVFGLLVFMLYGAASLWAQTSQDYINGSMSAQLASLKEDVAALKAMQNYVFTTVIGLLVVQLFGLLRKRRVRSDDDE